jgi:hypothetical protein
VDVQEIEVTIEKNGQVKIHVRGAKGKKCLDLTRELEQALGSAVINRAMTSEAQEDGSGNLIDQTVQVKK